MIYFSPTQPDGVPAGNWTQTDPDRAGLSCFACRAMPSHRRSGSAPTQPMTPLLRRVTAWWNQLFVGGFDFANPRPMVTEHGIEPSPNKGARQRASSPLRHRDRRGADAIDSGTT